MQIKREDLINQYVKNLGGIEDEMLETHTRMIELEGAHAHLANKLQMLVESIKQISKEANAQDVETEKEES